MIFMKVYIASSWKNVHGVEMLTKELRNIGYEVISWVENRFVKGEEHGEVDFVGPLWERQFQFDTDGARMADVFIYYGPAGCDAAVELGLAWMQRIADEDMYSGNPRALIVGLWAKGDPLGLMRKCVDIWFSDRALWSMVKYLKDHYEICKRRYG